MNFIDKPRLGLARGLKNLKSQGLKLEKFGLDPPLLTKEFLIYVDDQRRKEIKNDEPLLKKAFLYVRRSLKSTTV